MRKFRKVVIELLRRQQVYFQPIPAILEPSADFFNFLPNFQNAVKPTLKNFGN